MYQNTKRILDVTFSIICLIISFPMDVIIALIIKITSKGPVIFKQERIGKDGKNFKMYKFRSMKLNAEHTGTGVYSGKDDPRVTKIGKFIRKTSIDEFPQFINILKGDMSFIGPRPVLTYHPCKYEEYSKEQLKRFEVRPGITGWAQVNGRKGLDWDVRLKYDAEYVEKMSFSFDIKILLKTIKNVILMEDNVNTSKTANNKGEKKENVKVNVHN